MKYTKPIIIGVVGFIIFALLFFIITGIAIYKFNYEGRIAKGASRLIPYPVARVDWHLIRYSDFLFDLDTLKYFYESQEESVGMPIPDEKILRENVLERLTQNYFLERLAKKNNISVSKKEVEEGYKEIGEENQGEENLIKMLKDFYNWTPEIFKKKVIYYSLLGEKLLEIFESEQELTDELRAERASVKIKKYIR